MKGNGGSHGQATIRRLYLGILGVSLVVAGVVWHSIPSTLPRRVSPTPEPLQTVRLRVGLQAGLASGTAVVASFGTSGLTLTGNLTGAGGVAEVEFEVPASAAAGPVEMWTENPLGPVYRWRVETTSAGTADMGSPQPEVERRGQPRDALTYQPPPPTARVPLGDGSPLPTGVKLPAGVKVLSLDQVKALQDQHRARR